jgi:hypothetical protein
MLKLSHSAVSRYQTCPKSYKYHYIDKLRPKFTSSALLFGSALDHAINALLKDEGKDPKEVFDYNWRFAFINKNKEYLPKCRKVVYSQKEFDGELLLQEDLIELNQLCNPIAPLEHYKVLSNKRSAIGFNLLTAEEKEFYNFANWLCLRRKGHVMINSYKKEIHHLIKRVISVQEYIEIENEVGDKVIGYVDLVAELQDGRVVIFDLKTSSIDYEEDAVLTSPQLTLYVFCIGEKYNTRKAGYIVLKKQIKKNKIKICSSCSFDGTGSRHKTCNNEIAGKRCGADWNETIRPTADVQLIVDEVPQQAEDLVMENFNFIRHGIQHNMFHRNLNSCMQAWGPCPYRDLCWKNIKTDLVQE